MAGLRPQFYVSSSARAVNQGGAVPPWYGNPDNKGNWYPGTPEYDYYFYNVVDNGTTETYVNYTCYIQYGHNSTGWATAKFFVYSITGGVTYVGSNRDKQINANVTLRSFWSRQTDYASGGVSVVWDISIFSERIAGFTGVTTTEFTQNPNISRARLLTVPYGGNITTTCLGVAVTYPNGEYPNTNIQLGLALYNDIDPYYYPLAYRNYNNNPRYTSFYDIPIRTTGIRKGNTITRLGLLLYDQQNVSNVGNFRYRDGNQLKQVPLVYSRG